MKFVTAIVAALICVVATPAAAQTGTLEKIRQRGAIVMGYVNGAVPFSFVDDSKQPQGYSVELCRKIASGIRSQLGLTTLETRWVELTLQNRLEAVASGKVDIECSTTTWTLSRAQQVDFSLITFVDGGSILVRADSDARRLSELGGRRIAVISGTTTEKVLRASLEQRGIKAEVVTVQTRDAGLQLLDQDKVQGFASDRMVLVGVVLTGDSKNSFRLLDEDYSVEPYAFALPRGDPDFRLAVNRTLARVYRSGEIEGVYRQWLGKLGSPSLLLSAAYFIQGLAE